MKSACLNKSRAVKGDVVQGTQEAGGRLWSIYLGGQGRDFVSRRDASCNETEHGSSPLTCGKALLFEWRAKRTTRECQKHQKSLSGERASHKRLARDPQTPCCATQRILRISSKWRANPHSCSSFPSVFSRTLPYRYLSVIEGTFFRPFFMLVTVLDISKRAKGLKSFTLLMRSDWKKSFQLLIRRKLTHCYWLHDPL